MENQDQQTPGDGSGQQRPASRPRINPLFLLLLAGAAVLVWFMLYDSSKSRSRIRYSFFIEQVEAGRVKEVEIEGMLLRGKFHTEKSDTDDDKEVLPKELQYDQDGDEIKDENDKPLKAEFLVELHLFVRKDFDELLKKHGVQVIAKTPTDSAVTMMFVYIGITVLLFLGLWFMFRRARDQFMGGGILSSFSKSPAKRFDTAKKTTTFDDVAGMESVKEDLQEIIEFLKDPKKFQRLGGRVPKGVLLMGPPGTGKTLLARAVAGEADVPFFSINGSEFIQMFVGVGASRVRDMFKTAKDAAPAILFIDEIDAVGRHRGTGLGGGHDEREQTLNQILSEMDGFSPTQSVIVLAATNRPDVLDPALLRPGRFDRHVTIDRPGHKARVAIFKVHVRDVLLSDDVDLDRLASATIGLTGADIRNLVNESALWATRQDKDKVDMDDFEHAHDKILMGPKRDEVLTGKEKEMTAYHEAGHALLAWLLEESDRVHKVTIIPRGRALGVTQLLPEEEIFNVGESRLTSRLIFMLGGRAAEKLVFDEFSAGAESDLTQSTRLARKMVANWGMSERLGPVSFSRGEEQPFLGKEIHEARNFSEHTAQLIDEEITKLLNSAYDRARLMLIEQRDKLDTVAEALLEKEMLDDKDIEALIGPSARQLAASNGKAGKSGKAVVEAKGK
ncbi:MAG: ATP-dependent zinc metalloprotease FtsH [Planctomycetes bacterium]|nr:ATP-dependent zinc metalloprotease FtsH [Planctomycetota bacterium]